MKNLGIVKKTIIGFTLLATLGASASSYDVYGKGPKFIKVTEDSSTEKVGFELCLTARPELCKRIGRRKFYLKADLENLRTSERLDIASAAVADIGIIAVGIFGGAITGTAIGGGSWLTAASVYTVPGGVLVGAGAGVTASALIDAINPYEQYKQLETLENDVLNDDLVFVPFSSETFAKRLGAVLDNL